MDVQTFTAQNETQVSHFDSGGHAVAHFVHSYLFATGSWIYTQLINMKLYRPFVLTSNLENLNEFPFQDVHFYAPRIEGNGLLHKALRKAFEAITHSYDDYCIHLVRTKQAKLLHAHFGTEGYYRLRLQRSVDIPLVTTFYGFDMSQLPTEHPRWKKRYKQLFKVGTLFLAEGPFMAQALVDLGAAPQKVRIQHLGVDLTRIPLISRERQGREAVRILMAASFREKKGIAYGLQAFADAVKKYPEMVLRIVGGAKTQEEHRLLESCKIIVKRERLANKVHFLGYIPYCSYLSELESAHLFLAPSVRAVNGDTEGGAPVSLIEAAAGGMPVISTMHCDIPNVVVDGKSGLLVPERDVPALTEAILKLACSPEVWGGFGAAGRKRVEEEFNATKQVARLESIYEESVL